MTKAFIGAQWKDSGDYKEPVDSDPIRVSKVEIDGAATYIDKDGSGNLTLTDAVSGTQTLAALLSGGVTDHGALTGLTDDDHTQYLKESVVSGTGVPAVTLGTAGATGAATTVIATDATIVAFDGTVPTTQAFGDTAATGSAAVAARRDHKHAMPADPSYTHPNHTGQVTSVGDGATTVAGPVALTAMATQAAQTIVANATDGAAAPTAIAIAASQIVARLAAGSLKGCSTAEMKTLLAYLTDVVDDTSPTLGGNLACGGYTLTGAGHGIADNQVVTVDQADAADNDIAKFTANGLEGRSYAELKGDLDLEAGTDFPSLATFEDHSARHENGGADEISLAGLSGDPADTINKSLIDAKGDLIVGSADNTATRLAIGTDNYVLRVATDTAAWEAEFDATTPSDCDAVSAGAAGSAATAARRDHSHKVDAAIADDAILTVDDAAAADNDYAKFTANGIEGVAYATVLSDIAALPLAGGTMTGAITLGANGIVLTKALSSDHTYSGPTVAGAAGENVNFGSGVYLKFSDNEWYLWDKDAEATTDAQLGIVVTNAAKGDGDAITVAMPGCYVRDDTWAFDETKQYVGDSGALADHTAALAFTTGDFVRRIGTGFNISSTYILHFNPSEDYGELV